MLKRGIYDKPESGDPADVANNTVPDRKFVHFFECSDDIHREPDALHREFEDYLFLVGDN
jgi:hypothetical protein